MIDLVENDISVEEYFYLRNKVNWKHLTDRQAQLALSNCLFNVKAVDENGTILGMGRIVGDGAVISYIQDLIVIPEAQGRGIGSLIIERLIAYVKSLCEGGSEMMLCLMCAKGREPFYIKHGFVARPTEDLGPGMIQYII
ncbi:MAG: GNAT family N-acetyltransferase [Clostridium sp.]|nr:GNAT family N-acetyltransferase [Clostridium sp.]